MQVRSLNSVLLMMLIPLWTTAQESPRTHVVSTQGPYTSLAAAVAAARDGDTVAVYGGTYAGPVVIDKSLRLEGHDWPVVDGGGQGTVLKLMAPATTITGLVIRHSGSSLEAENSGVAVEAPAAVIADNRLQDTLFGIYLRRAPESVIRDNVIHGKDLPVPRRGDAIRVWYSNSVHIENNRVERGRDVVLWYSQQLTLRGNTVREGRYGLHFMYCDDALIDGNRLLHNSVGAFLMYSRRLSLHHNLIAHNRGPSGYGIGMKDLDDAVVQKNMFLDNRVGAFVDNSPREIDSSVHFTGNVFAYNTMGVSLMPSVRRNYFTANSFIDNQEQVHVAGGGELRDNVWTVDGRGNYWSDYRGYDADGDRRGDIPYKAERLFEDLLDRHPVLQVFLHSPAVQAIDLAARAFPLIKPQPKLTDTAPLMAWLLPAGLPPPPPAQRRPLFLASLGLLGLVCVLGMVSRLSSWQRGRRHPCAVPGGYSMLVVDHLTKRFGSITAVADVSFGVEVGEALALWGPNGAGKTTILRCLLGLLRYGGTVHLADYDVQYQGKQARQLVGFVPQEMGLYDEMTVREITAFYSGLKKTSTAEGMALLERVGLVDHATKAVRSLSGGMKQRLALALALLADPPLLILDEPTANLDAEARQALITLLAELKAADKTIVFSSHRAEEVQALADRVLVLEDGRLVADGPPRLLRATCAATALRLYIAGELLDPALTALTEHGFSATCNGSSLRVQVLPGEKGGPLHVLAQAHIPVRDFDLEHEQCEVDRC